MEGEGKSCNPAILSEPLICFRTNMGATLGCKEDDTKPFPTWQSLQLYRWENRHLVNQMRVNKPREGTCYDRDFRSVTTEYQASG